jgi:hypothetical protein
VLNPHDSNSSSSSGAAPPEGGESELEDGLNMAQLVLQLLCRRLEEGSVAKSQEGSSSGEDLVTLCTTLSRPVVLDVSARAVDELESHFDKFPQARQDHFRGVATLVVRAVFAEGPAASTTSSGISSKERASWETWAAETCARVVCNGHGVSHDGQWAIPEAALALGNRAAAVALYTSGSLFNHACAPTCAVAFDRRGRLTVRALVALQPGDEATLSYAAGLAPRASRAADLAGTYFFTCQCAKCAAVEAAGVAMEQIRSGGGSSSSSNVGSDESATRVWGAEEDMNDCICRCGGALAPLPPGEDGNSSKKKKNKKNKDSAEGSASSSSGNLQEAAWACMACRKKQAINKHFAALGMLQEALALVAQELAGVEEEEDEEELKDGNGEEFDIYENDGEGEEVSSDVEEDEAEEEDEESDGEVGEENAEAVRIADGDLKDGKEVDGSSSGSSNDPAQAYNALQQALQQAAGLLHDKHALIFAAHVALLGCAALMTFDGSAAPSLASASASGASQSDSDDGRAGTAALCARLSTAPPHVKTAVIGHAETSLNCLKVAQYRGEFNKAVALLRKLRAACL